MPRSTKSRAQGQSRAVAKGPGAADIKVNVKNTFIEIADDPEGLGPGATPEHVRRRTMPDLQMQHGEQDDQSRNPEATGSVSHAPEKDDVVQRPATRITVKNTFINEEADELPSPVNHRQYRTCPVELNQDEHSTVDDVTPDGAQGQELFENGVAPTASRNSRRVSFNPHVAANNFMQTMDSEGPTPKIGKFKTYDEFSEECDAMQVAQKHPGCMEMDDLMMPKNTEVLQDSLMRQHVPAESWTSRTNLTQSPAHVSGPFSLPGTVPTSPPRPLSLADACARQTVAKGIAPGHDSPLGSMPPLAMPAGYMGWPPMPLPYPWPMTAQVPWPWPWVARPDVEGLMGAMRPPMPNLGVNPMHLPLPTSSPSAMGGGYAQIGAGTLASPSQDPLAAVPAAESSPHTAGSRPRGGTRRLRLWAHIYLHMQVPGFDLVPRLIGRGGCNMRRIAEQTGSKIRIRGRGSGHLEIDGQREAPTPLMVAVTTDKCDAEGFRKAIALTLQELHTVEQHFHAHCAKNSISHEGPCFSIGLLPDKGKEVLGHIINNVPFANHQR